MQGISKFHEVDGYFGLLGFFHGFDIEKDSFKLLSKRSAASRNIKKDLLDIHKNLYYKAFKSDYSLKTLKPCKSIKDFNTKDLLTTLKNSSEVQKLSYLYGFSVTNFSVLEGEEKIIFHHNDKRIIDALNYILIELGVHMHIVTFLKYSKIWEKKTHYIVVKDSREIDIVLSHLPKIKTYESLAYTDFINSLTT